MADDNNIYATIRLLIFLARTNMNEDKDFHSDTVSSDNMQEFNLHLSFHYFSNLQNPMFKQ